MSRQQSVNDLSDRFDRQMNLNAKSVNPYSNPRSLTQHQSWQNLPQQFGRMHLGGIRHKLKRSRKACRSARRKTAHRRRRHH